jgi:hypothetical protein
MTHLFLVAVLSAFVTAASCVSAPTKHLVFEQRLTLPNSRWTGPLDITVPSPAQHQGRALAFVTKLTSACSPKLVVGNPDGTDQSIGSADEHWQLLQTTQATYQYEPQNKTPDLSNTGQQHNQLQPGHWQATALETWPGQIAFEDLRRQKCANIKSWTTEHISSVDGNGLLSVWSEVPQQLESATLFVQVFELIDSIDTAPELKLTTGAETTTAAGQITLQAQRKPPPPKIEQRAAAADPTAVWQAGSWRWQPKQGLWIWIDGWYRQPSTIPSALADTARSPSPLQGCSWQNGYWTWLTRPGKWRWSPGPWLPPPPRVEVQGIPPIAEQPWIAGYWSTAGSSFEWNKGRWGKPLAKMEVPGPTCAALCFWTLRPGLWNHWSPVS